MMKIELVVVACALGSVSIAGCGETQAVPEDPTSFSGHADVGSYADAPYAKLCSETFVNDYAGKSVHLKAMFIGEWTSTSAYKAGGIDTDDRVFVNHRDVSYSQQTTGLGGSDDGFPGFALSVPKSKSDIVYQLKRGDTFEVWGRTREAGLPGQRGLHIFADRMQKAE
ncbi:MAG: hypothetical protein WCW31_00350 [Patescibacteria group bacterium]